MWWTDAYCINSNIWGSKPSPTKRFIETQKYNFSLFSGYESDFLSLTVCFPFLSLALNRLFWSSKTSKCLIYNLILSLLVFHFPPSHFFLKLRWVRGDYLFSSQSPKSSEKHQSPFNLSRILSRSRSRAQKSTAAYGSYIRPGVWGPLHLLVELREQAENMMVICLLGPLSSHCTCSHKCFLPLLFLLPESLVLAIVLWCSLFLPFILVVQPCASGSFS